MRLALVSLPLALLLWAAVRFSPMTTLVGTILVVIFISLLTGLGLGGFTRPPTLLDASVLMLLLVLISVIPVMLAVATYEQRHTATALFQRATRDPLTGLLNRSTFEERARERLTGEKAEPDLSLLYLDLDHFKLVNDSASHVAGDDMIRTVAGAWSARSSATKRWSRAPAATNSRCCVPVSESQRDHLRPAPARVHRRPARRLAATRCSPPRRASASRTASRRTATSTSLLSHADAACFAAKESAATASLPLRAKATNCKLRTRLDALGAAGARGARPAPLQPVLPADHHLLRSGVAHAAHFEILLRWTDAQGQVRAPAELIAAAERYRLGPRLDRYVVEAVLQLARSASRASGEHRTIAASTSAARTLVDEEFRDYFAARLRRSSVPPERLCLEITETSVVRDRTRAQRFIQPHARPGLPLRARRLRHRLLLVRLPAATSTSIT